MKIYFVVYDLLPVQSPHWFPELVGKCHTEWLQTVIQYDGAICISKTVSNELRVWYQNNSVSHDHPFTIDWFHLGADIENSMPINGLPADAGKILEVIDSRLSFLMVGTIEPRKGHLQVLEAFEQLWRESHDVNLVIVGKQGWMVEALVERLCACPEQNKRLFWLEGISDEYLEKVYAASTCLIAASYGEGFGLPLIEAAQHKLPIIARDIPVFREVAGEYAYYFNASTSVELAAAVLNWLVLFEKKRYPDSCDIKYSTWSECADKLSRIVLERK